MLNKVIAFTERTDELGTIKNPFDKKSILNFLSGIFSKETVIEDANLQNKIVNFINSLVCLYEKPIYFINNEGRLQRYSYNYSERHSLMEDGSKFSPFFFNSEKEYNELVPIITKNSNQAHLILESESNTPLELKKSDLRRIKSMDYASEILTSDDKLKPNAKEILAGKNLGEIKSLLYMLFDKQKKYSFHLLNYGKETQLGTLENPIPSEMFNAIKDRNNNTKFESIYGKIIPTENDKIFINDSVPIILELDSLHNIIIQNGEEDTPYILPKDETARVKFVLKLFPNKQTPPEYLFYRIEGENSLFDGNQLREECLKYSSQFRR